MHGDFWKDVDPISPLPSIHSPSFLPKKALCFGIPFSHSRKISSPQLQGSNMTGQLEHSIYWPLSLIQIEGKDLIDTEED